VPRLPTRYDAIDPGGACRTRRLASQRLYRRGRAPTTPVFRRPRRKAARRPRRRGSGTAILTRWRS